MDGWNTIGKPYFQVLYRFRFQGVYIYIYIWYCKWPFWPAGDPLWYPPASSKWPFSNLIYKWPFKGINYQKGIRKKLVHICTWICFCWRLLRIAPWHSSPFCTTMWDNIFGSLFASTSNGRSRKSKVMKLTGGIYLSHEKKTRPYFPLNPGCVMTGSL